MRISSARLCRAIMHRSHIIPLAREKGRKRSSRARAPNDRHFANCARTLPRAHAHTESVPAALSMRLLPNDFSARCGSVFLFAQREGSSRLRPAKLDPKIVAADRRLLSCGRGRLRAPAPQEYHSIPAGPIRQDGISMCRAAVYFNAPASAPGVRGASAKLPCGRFARR